MFRTAGQLISMVQSKLQDCFSPPAASVMATTLVVLSTFFAEIKTNANYMHDAVTRLENTHDAKLESALEAIKTNANYMHDAVTTHDAKLESALQAERANAMKADAAREKHAHEAMESSRRELAALVQRTNAELLQRKAAEVKLHEEHQAAIERRANAELSQYKAAELKLVAEQKKWMKGLKAMQEQCKSFYRQRRAFAREGRAMRNQSTLALAAAESRLTDAFALAQEASEIRQTNARKREARECKRHLLKRLKTVQSETTSVLNHKLAVRNKELEASIEIADGFFSTEDAEACESPPRTQASIGNQQ